MNRIYMIMVCGVMLLPNLAWGQFSKRLLEEIAGYIHKGDAAGISKYLDASVYLLLPDDVSENFSKDLSKIKINDFFRANPVSSFTLTNHKEPIKDDQPIHYALGKLITTDGVHYKVHMKLKKANQSYQLQEFAVTEDTL